MHGNVELGGMCCGVGEYHGLNEDWHSAREVLYAIAHEAEEFRRENLGSSYCHVYLTQIDGTARLRAVQSLIEREGLGHWVRTRPSVNPNSGNMVTAAFYTPNKRALIAWYKENFAQRIALARAEERRWHTNRW